MSTKMNHLLSVEETIQSYETNLQSGLSDTEVKARQEKYGLNQLAEAKKRSIFLKILDQFKDFMIIILLVAAVIAIAVGEVTNGLLIIAIVIVNAILSVIQEAKAEKSTEAIKALSSPHVTVVRNGTEKVIDVKEIVIGDLVLLEAGDYVPADVRIIESINLKADESALTGEPVPVEKVAEALEGDDIPLGDRINLGFMGTVITYGRGKAIVTAVGMDTEIGKIASMLSETESESTPLQKNIAKLGKTLAIVALAITGAIFILEIAQAAISDASQLAKPDIWVENFIFAVSLAVAAIPEGLPAIITVVLSIGMSSLARQKAIMRTLPAVETLGSTSIICSDKTGTLTQNIMTVQQVYLNNGLIDINAQTKVDDNLAMLTQFGVLVNDTKVQEKGESFIKIGDPTELAFIDLAVALKKNPVEIKENFVRLHELPFDSERKLMTTVHMINGKTYAIIKGAPDVIFGKSTAIHQMDMKDLNKFVSANEDMANRALRVLAVAYKEIKDTNKLKSLSFDDLETGLTLLGLVGMIDPERPEVKDAIAVCNKAGIKTIMITGDHKNTAMAIAKNLNILGKNDLAITGKELDDLSDEEFDAKLSSIRVYARVSPENKVRIVKAWRKTGLVVAMTGDGVNDAPSIKQADIGIAMGITGTEVAKGAADMVLTDDNFATIVNAVGEGRTIFANIKKAIHFLLSCNIGEIVAMTLGVLLAGFLFKDIEGSHHLLTAAQILWVNLVTDSLLAIGIGLEKKEPNVMDYAPRDASKSIFADGLGFRVAWQGILVGILTFLAYTIGYHWNGAHDPKSAQTMAFMVLAVIQLFHAFNVRSDKYSTFKLRANWWLVGAFFVSLTLQLAVITIPPFAGLFNVALLWELDFAQWLIVLGFALTPLVIVEILKLLKIYTRK